jgi:hypothetical protein
MAESCAGLHISASSVGVIGQGLVGRASGGETFTRSLPHTPSSNALASPLPVAGIGTIAEPSAELRFALFRQPALSADTLHHGLEIS